MEYEFDRTGDVRLRPNVRTYTGAITAVARSKVRPDRAEEILRRMEDSYDKGINGDDARPDVVCFNAVMNAWAWSGDDDGDEGGENDGDEDGDNEGDNEGDSESSDAGEGGGARKALRANAHYERMLNLYESGTNVAAKPDLISCNALLSACAHSRTEDDNERAALVDVCVSALGRVQERKPELGRPNHVTYSTALLVFINHLPHCELRDDLSRTVFQSSCRDGQVSGLVVSSLLKAVSEGAADGLLGNALLKERDDEGRRIFDARMLPREWTKYGGGRKSRPSQKKQR